MTLQVLTPRAAPPPQPQIARDHHRARRPTGPGQVSHRPADGHRPGPKREGTHTPTNHRLFTGLCAVLLLTSRHRCQSTRGSTSWSKLHPKMPRTWRACGMPHWCFASMIHLPTRRTRCVGKSGTATAGTASTITASRSSASPMARPAISTRCAGLLPASIPYKDPVPLAVAPAMACRECSRIHIRTYMGPYT